MDAVNEDSEVPPAVAESLCEDPAVEFAVLFGSRHTDEERASSDVDIAVKFSERLSSHERFKKRCFLAGDLQRAGAPFVDLSDLDALSIDVAHDAVNGAFLCGDEDAFSETKRQIDREYAAQADEIRTQHRNRIDRIAEDGLHG